MHTRAEQTGGTREAKGEGQCKVKVNTMSTMDVCAEHVVR